MDVDQAIQIFEVEFDNEVTPVVEWGSTVGFGVLSLIFIVYLLSLVIRKYTSD